MQKLADVALAVKKFYFVITNRDQRRRPITEILDHLANPEILDQPNLTRDDIARYLFFPLPSFFPFSKPPKTPLLPCSFSPFNILFIIYFSGQ
jgi:hypothetical protein